MLELLTSFWESTGFSMIFEMMPLELFGLQLMLPGHLIMIIIACIFLYLSAVRIFPHPAAVCIFLYLSSFCISLPVIHDS